MTIPQSTVEHVAKLARLELSQADLERYSIELSRILELVETLSQLDLSQVDVDMTVESPPVLREDGVQPGISRETLLKNAPVEEDGFFRVPKILEEA